MKRKMEYGIVLAASAILGLAGAAQASDVSAKTAAQAGDDLDARAASDCTEIRAQGQEITVDGGGASADGTTVSITKGGSYRLSGSLEEGQIYVEAGKKEDVTLILDGFSVTNSEGDAVHIENAQSVTILLEDGTENTIESGRETAIDADAEPESGTAEGAALYARDDLAIEGDGALTVKGYINNGIHTTNNLTVASGDLQVTAVNNALKGKDSVTVTGGNISALSGGDGIQSDDDSGEGYGVVRIGGGTVRVECYGDGIYAETKLEVENGSIDVVQSNEGLEANQITISGGDLSIRAADDGINACGGNGGGFGRGGGWGAGRWDFDGSGGSKADGQKADGQKADGQKADGQKADGQGTDGQEDDGAQKTSEEMPNLTITGGTIYVNADGDGLDSNGNITINGGTVIVDGPASSGNGAIDCGTEIGGTCVINGGTLLAIGSSGMDEGFSGQSGQCSFRYGSANGFQAGDRIVIADAQGSVLMEHEAAKNGASVIFSDPRLAVGESYTLTVGDEETVIAQDAVVTTAGSVMGFGRGDLPMGHGPQMRKGMTPPDGFDSEQPEGMTPPGGFDGEQPEGMTPPGGFDGEQPGDMTPPEDVSPEDYAANLTLGASGV